MNQREITPFREGQRVEFGAEFRTERDSAVVIPAGSTAVVDYVDDFLITLTLERPVPGLERWDNQVDFKSSALATASRILRVLADR